MYTGVMRNKVFLQYDVIKMLSRIKPLPPAHCQFILSFTAATVEKEREQERETIIFSMPSMCKYNDDLDFGYVDSIAPLPTKRTPKININYPQQRICIMFHPRVTLLEFKITYLYPILLQRSHKGHYRENTVTNKWDRRKGKRKTKLK